MNNALHFHQLLDVVPHMVWTADANGNVDYVNPMLTDDVDQALVIVATRQWIEAVHPDDRVACAANWRAAVQAGTPFTAELRIFRHAEQSYRRYRVEASPIRNAHDEITKWIGTAIDIHDSKVFPQAFMSLARHFYTTLENMVDAVITLDHAWRFTFLNAPAQRLARRSSVDLSGKIIWQEFPELKACALERRLRTCRAKKHAVETELFHTHMQAWFQVHAWPSEDGVTVVFRDISSQKTSAAALNQSTEHFINIAKATSDLIWDWDLINDKVLRSSAYATLFGMPTSQVIAADCGLVDNVHRDDRTRVLENLVAVINGNGDIWSDEYRFLLPDGSCAHVLDRAFVIRDTSGKAVRVVGGITDVTEHKRAEESLARANRALRMLSACNKAVIHATDEAALLGEMCRIAVDVGGYRMAWVGYAEDDEAGMVVPMAYAGELNEPDFIDTIKISKSAAHPRGQGPGGQSMRSGKAVVCRDMQTEAILAPWREAGQRNGFHGIISLPLKQGEQVFGLMALYSAEPLQISDADVESLQDMANNLAFGIGNLRSQRRRQQVEAAVLKVASGVSGSAGEQFFEHLARSMADALGAQGGFIAKLVSEAPFRARTISAIVDGEIIDNFEYDIAATPCETSHNSHYCVVRQRVSDIYTESFRLREFGAQAYVGYRLDGSNGRPLGLVFVLYREPLTDVEFVTSTLQIFAARAAAELERYDADARLRNQAALLDKTRDAIIVCDIGHHVLFWNKGAERLYGWTAHEIMGENKNQFLYADSLETAIADKAVQQHGEWSGQLSYRRKDGTTVPVEAHWSLVRDDDGRPQSIFTINTDITQRKADEREIQQLAFYDMLTGLPNRRLLQDRLGKLLADHERTGHIGAVLYIDLDNFKSLNDTVGHDKGDLLLRQVATRLKTCVRKGNTVARLGGDEFVIVLDDLAISPVKAAAVAEAVAEKVLESFRQPFQLNGVEHRSTPSIGVTLFDSEIGSIDELLKRADLAMYEAKGAGRNTIRFFDPHMQNVINTRVALEADLRDGLRRMEFALHYQAQADRNGNLTGVEALIRWKHPQRGHVSPVDFIPLAEDTGLIMALGEWVLETACAQLAKWAHAPQTAALSIAVNVSAKQFRHPDFVPQVLNTLTRNRVGPHRLKLELTESLLIDDMEATVVKMNALKSEGISFSLDDFGTGYSSLSYLKRLPLDQLKIDQSFVHDVLTNSNDAAIAKTILALGHSLGLNVIAEGVETIEQRNFLAGHGCNAYQGYLYGHPLEIDQFEDALRRSWPSVGSAPFSDGRHVH